MSASLVIRSLSLFISSFKGAAVGFDVSGCLAIIACSIVPGLAPASLIFWQSGITSSSVVRSVGLVVHRPHLPSLLQMISS